MKDKFLGKYRIPSSRLKNWDYGWNGSYFVTICTHKRECYFGNVVDGEMKLSEIGKIANQFWLEIPLHFPFVVLGNHIIMPNHVHGIITINKSNDKQNHVKHIVKTSNLGVYVPATNTKTSKLGVYVPATNTNTSKLGVYVPATNTKTSKLDVSNHPTNTKSTGGKNNKWESGNMGVIINQYKRICTIHARKINPDFKWQSRYYDHVIRNARSFHSISKYILNNPMKWNKVNYRIDR